ncbi:hypothetical protein V8F20_008077 [Naviculisporaceae sp. PSN 640]
MAGLPIRPKDGQDLPQSIPGNDLSDDWETVTVPETEQEITNSTDPIEGFEITPDGDDSQSLSKAYKPARKSKSGKSTTHLSHKFSSRYPLDEDSGTESPLPHRADTALLAGESSSQIDASMPLTGVFLALGFSPLENESTLPPSLITAVRNRLSMAYLTTSLTAAKSSPKPYATLPHFVFGAFIFPTVVSAVVRDLSREEVARCMTPGTLKGYKKCGVKHATFPAAFPTSEAGAEIHGMVIFGMDTPERRAKMEKFQAGMYDLQRGIAEVVSAEGETIQHEVVVYVWNGPSSGLFTPEERKWCASAMMRGDWLSETLEGNGEVVRDLPAAEEME